MRGNLLKSPLAALLYAALLNFIAIFLPFSEPYGQALASFATRDANIFGCLMLLAYSLFITVTAAVAFSVLDKSMLFTALYLLPAFLGFQWALPLANQLILGELTGVMTLNDTLMRLMQGSAGTVTLLLLCMLLFTPKTPPPKEKHKLRWLRLIIFLLVLPVIYSVLYFLIGYFLGWRSEAVRAYYNGGDNLGLLEMLISMLLEKPVYAGLALLKGLLLALFSLPLMLALPLKRVMFILLNVMLYLCGALLFIFPNPLMPDDARITHLIAESVILAVYGGLSGFLLHICFRPGAVKAAEAPAQQQAPPQNQAPPQHPPGKTIPSKIPAKIPPKPRI